MILAQTYNADAKEESGLDGITLNEVARTKWVYTKPITAAIASQFKDMMQVTPGTDSDHDSGKSKTVKDYNLTTSLVAATDTNP